MAPWLSFTCSVVLIMLSTMALSKSSPDANYNKCSSLCSCGPVKGVGYPFWEDNVRPTFCGLHPFRLKCTNSSSYPTIALDSLGTGHYNVHRVNTSSQTIIVSRDTNETCHLLQSQTSLIVTLMSPFKLGPNVEEVTLFYGCLQNTTTIFQNLSFGCPTFDDSEPIYYFNETSHGSKCQTKVTVPVSKTALQMLHLQNANLKEALGQEFEIQYAADLSKCSACQNSGGICGSSFNFASDFVCHKSGKKSITIVVLILVSGFIGATLLAVAAIMICLYRKTLKSGHPRLVSRNVSLEPTSLDYEKGSTYFGVPLFSYRELAEATNNFDDSRQLGSGGFGIVFAGNLKDGRKVAVKCLYEKSYRRVEQFMNEVQILTCLRHQNLVSLYGCTSPDCKQLLLVYEYVPNGTVADHLYGSKVKSGSLSWDVRMRIAIQTATALAFLHASEIIHRDVKTYNILLDSSFGVKVADFGLSRLFPTDVTHVSTAPQGTPGYVDPEYHQCYQLTVKSDVYSFGVVLIELISSLPAVDTNRQKHDINLSNYAMRRIHGGLLHELVDPKLGFESDLRVKRMIISVAELAFQCLQHDKDFRPSMDEVLEVLKRTENADEELGEKKEPKADKMGVVSTKTPGSPTEEDDAGLLINVSSRQEGEHPASPSSVMDRWGSRSTATTSKPSR